LIALLFVFRIAVQLRAARISI